MAPIINGAASQVKVSDLKHAAHTAAVASQLSLIAASSTNNPSKAIATEEKSERNTGVYLSLSEAAARTLNTPPVSASILTTRSADLSGNSAPQFNGKGGDSSSDSTVGTRVDHTV